MSPLEVRVLTPGDTDACVSLRRESLELEPLAFAASPEDDRGQDPIFVRRALAEHGDAVTVGAFSPELIGAVGVSRDAHRKAAHKAHIWGMYVRPGYRRAGVGAALLSAAIAHARGLAGILQVHLSVSETADAAFRLYQRHGFEIWGTEPRALHHSGRFVAEHHLVLRLT